MALRKQQAIWNGALGGRDPTGELTNCGKPGLTAKWHHSAMLKIIAAIVIAFFAVLWGTGNDVASFKHSILHWADGNPEMTGRRSDWGI